MILANAETAEDIAAMLRGERQEVNDRIRAAEIADRLLGIKKKISGMIITAPRQSGKTTELIRYAEEKYPNGPYAVVTPSFGLQVSFLACRRHMVGDTVLPLMLLPDNFSYTRRSFNSIPIFCDEWNLIPESSQDNIIGTGMFVAAVTS